jgi:hypothetical protein
MVHTEEIVMGVVAIVNRILKTKIQDLFNILDISYL